MKLYKTETRVLVNAVTVRIQLIFVSVGNLIESNGGGASAAEARAGR